MKGITHMVIGAVGVSLVIQTADTKLLALGAFASLLPDIDTSNSLAGWLCPWASRWLEKRFPHRSCTHSLVASLAIAVASYPIVLSGLLDFWAALNTGYFLGYFADAFTANGCEMFWPSSVRCVWPGNRAYRLSANSLAEHVVLAVFVLLLFALVWINTSGGIMTQFNRLVGSPDGVEQLYNEQGSKYLLVAHIKGVRQSDRAPVNGDYWIIESHGQGFIVLSKAGEIYKAGTEPDCQLITQRITADLGPVATTTIEALELEEDQISLKLQQFNRAGAMVFASGQLAIDDDEALKHLLPDSYQFPILRTETNKVIFNTAPLQVVVGKLGDEFATGHLSLRSIYAQQQASSSSSSKS